jgi:hypothetical protein
MTASLRGREPWSRGTWWVTAHWGRLSTCCSELQNMWISDSAIVICSYDQKVFNKSNYQSKLRLQSHAYTWQYYTLIQGYPVYAEFQTRRPTYRVSAVATLFSYSTRNKNCKRDVVHSQKIWQDRIPGAPSTFERPLTSYYYGQELNGAQTAWSLGRRYSYKVYRIWSKAIEG